MTLQAAAQDVAMVHLGDVRRMQEELGAPSWEHVALGVKNVEFREEFHEDLYNVILHDFTIF